MPNQKSLQTFKSADVVNNSQIEELPSENEVDQPKRISPDTE